MAKSEKRPTTLVTRFSALGDVAMTLPLLYNVARSNPQRHFLLLTRPHAARIFLALPENLEVRGIDLEANGSPSRILALCKGILEEYDVDSYADLHDVLRTKLMRLYLQLRGVRVCHINKMRSARRALTRRSNKHLLPLTPVHALYADVFNALGIHRETSFSSLFGPDGAPVGMLDAIPGAAGGKGQGNVWIAIAPFARHKGKIYPPLQMRRVVDALARIPEVTLFMLGAGEEEIATIDSWRDGHENIVNVGSLRAGFPAELALLSHCDALLSMDSANMHLGSLVGCPVVSIWGATHPFTGFYGRGQSLENAVQLALPCRPCSIYGNRPCRRGDYLCLAGLSPDVVVSHLRRVCAL